MTSTQTVARPDTHQGPAWRYWLTVTIVACGTFSIVSTEMMPVGLLTLLTDDLETSNGIGGQALTVTALTAFLAAPLLTIAAGRADRRVMLLGMMGVLLAANVVTAAAGHIAILFAGRVLLGLALGGFWSIGASLAVRLVPPDAVPRATSIIFSGVSIASVVGVPLGSVIGEHAGWRAAFGALAVLSGIVLTAQYLVLPPLPSDRRMRLGEITGALRGDRAIRISVIVTLAIIIGHFAAYTYVTPVLRDSVGIGAGAVSVILLIYGTAGVIGTFAAGALAARSVRAVIVGGATLIAAATLLLPLAGGLLPAVLLLVVWGLGYGAVPVGLQTWNLTIAPRSGEAVSVIFVAFFQMGIALGAALGGLLADNLGRNWPVWAAGGAAAATVLLVGRAGPVQPAE